MEVALSDEGIQPSVVSTIDAIEGALPIVHSPCTVIKVHGDYLDSRLRNTASELEVYEPALNEYLDRLFDEFGMIVCGWSAYLGGGPNREHDVLRVSRLLRLKQL
jgi:hypothetical protein